MPPKKTRGRTRATPPRRNLRKHRLIAQRISSTPDSTFYFDLPLPHAPFRHHELSFLSTLPNGKETVAFLQCREKKLLGDLSAGEKVRVVINPADFDRARICSRI